MDGFDEFKWTSLASQKIIWYCTVWRMKWHNICVILLEKDKQRGKEGERPGRSEPHVLFLGKAFDFILLLWNLLCDTYCVLLFVDCMMNLERCVSVFELRFLTLLMLCCGVSVTHHQLSNWLSCIFNVFGCHCRPLGTCVWCMSCYLIYQCLYYVFSLSLIYNM